MHKKEENRALQLDNFMYLNDAGVSKQLSYGATRMDKKGV